MQRFRLPLLISALVYLAIVAAVLHANMERTDAHLVYPLDDTYIHMSIAKNLAQHGVFGVTRHEFTPAASSLLWPLLLAAAFKVLGAQVWLPLALNVLLSLATLIVAAWVFKKLNVRSQWAFLAFLLALCFFVPLLTMTFVAMEHTLHVLLSIVFAGLIAADCEAQDQVSTPGLLVCSALLGATRYEGLFLIAAATALYLFRGNIRRAASLACAGWFGPLVFGLYSLHRGSAFLPNSLIVKGASEAILPLVRLRFFWAHSRRSSCCCSVRPSC